MTNMRGAYHKALTELLGGTWTKRAACGGKSLVMENPDDTPAKAVCGVCPVIRECTRWVMSLSPREEPDGVVAGMNRRDRRRARRRRGGHRAQATLRARKTAEAS